MEKSIEQPINNHELKSGTGEGDKIEAVEESATCSNYVMRHDPISVEHVALEINSADEVRPSMKKHTDDIKSSLDRDNEIEKNGDPHIKYIRKPDGTVSKTQTGEDNQLKTAGEVSKTMTRNKRKPQKRKLNRNPHAAKTKKSRRVGVMAMYVGKLSNVVPFQKRRIDLALEDSLGDSESDSELDPDALNDSEFDSESDLSY